MKSSTWFALLLALLAMSAGIWFQQTTRSIDVKQVAATQLNFSLPDLEGMEQSISQWHGKILVINFWATWCTPCLQEIPEFIKLQQQYQSKGLQFIGIAVDDKASVQQFAQRLQINYPLLIAGDSGADMARQFGNIIGALPFTLIVDQQGQIVHRQFGELSGENLLEILRPLFATI